MRSGPAAVTGRRDAAARAWQALLNHLDYPAIYRTMLAALLDDHLQGARPGALRTLDCGIGTGALSAALAEVAPVPLRLYGIDISARMLARARACLASRGLAPALHLGDARSLPYDDDMFDITMSAHLLEHFADPRAALREMVRVTRPGGLIVVCLTRRSAQGLLIHMQWRTHMVAPSEAETWLRECGLPDAARVMFAEQRTFTRRSIAYTGTKPFSTSTKEIGA